MPRKRMKKGRPHMRTCRRRGWGQQEGPAWGFPVPGHSQEPPYLPLLALGVLDHAEQGEGVVELPELQERGESGSCCFQRLRLEPIQLLPLGINPTLKPQPGSGLEGSFPEDPSWDLPPVSGQWSPRAKRKPQASL